MRIDSVRELKASAKDLFPAQVTARDLGASPELKGEQAAGGARAFTVDMPARRLSRSKPLPLFALGIASKRKGPDGFRLAVRIQHRNLENSAALDEVVRLCRGEADVRYIGPVIKRTLPWSRQRHRPLAIGTSVAHFAVTAGSLGAFVGNKRGNVRYLLSNNHVLADENEGAKGDKILQPGSADGGTKRFAVATLDKFIRLEAGGTINFVDCALGRILDNVDVDLFGLQDVGGPLEGTADDVAELLDRPDALSKIGRTTGLTHGALTAIEVDDVKVEYDIGLCRFDNQLEVAARRSHFSLGGDSGSLVFNADRLAVGLLFAGSDAGGPDGFGVTYVNPIDEVLGRLGVDLIL